jgi:hypothetical protein
VDGNAVWVARPIALMALMVFLWLLKRHERLHWQLQRCTNFLRLTKDDLARCQQRFADLPFVDLGAYGNAETLKDSFWFDLDFDQQDSFLKLLGPVPTHRGLQALAEWLTSLPDRQTWERRQKAVRLAIPLRRARLAFWSTFLDQAIVGQTPGQGAEVDAFRDFAQWAPPATMRLPGALVVLGVTGGFWMAYGFSWFTSAVDWWWILLAQVGWHALLIRWQQRALWTVERTQFFAGRLKSLLEFDAQLTKVFLAEGLPAESLVVGLSAADQESLANFCRWSSRLEVRHNAVGHFFLNGFFLWDWWTLKRAMTANIILGTKLGSWWEASRSLEALAALAHFPYCAPEAVFPEWPQEEGVVLKAQNLVHPCLSAASRVGQTFQVSAAHGRRAHLITGSNMSGKSTFMRTLALSAVMGNAGLPLMATQAVFRPCRVLTSMHQRDHMATGTSAFYAEVLRLRQIWRKVCDREEIPLVFLDEILKGTNSKERLSATRQLLEAFLDRGAIVFVSTHDLELLRLAESSSRLALWHFSDQDVEGVMTFDYRIKEGPLTSTNALQLMRQEGLPIEQRG